MMSYLIDTNVLIWYAKDAPQLPTTFRTLFLRNDFVFWISVVSLWEITIKASRGDLEIIGDLNIFLKSRITELGFKILPVTTEHLITLHALPFHHKDPFDRLIVAQSLTEKLPLLYTDKIFETYFTEEA